MRANPRQRRKENGDSVGDTGEFTRAKIAAAGGADYPQPPADQHKPQARSAAANSSKTAT
jgi:hypothetical protein